MRLSRAAVAAMALLAACGAEASNEAPQPSAAARQREASAAPPSARPSPITLVGCRQGGCFWERRLSERDVTLASGATLREFLADTGESRHGDDLPEAYDESVEIDWGGRRTTWVRCSPTAPLVAFRRSADTQVVVHHLDLFETAGYNLSSARLYMQTCHSRDYVEDEAVLRGLGLRPGTRNEQVEVASIEEVGG